MLEPNSASAALGALLPTDESPDHEHIVAFRRCAELLLNQCTLRIAGVAHRLTEIEFYWTSTAHADPFTHRDPLQQEFARWYFHRLGGTYRGGTFKGLDIAIGSPQRHAGILLRGIENTSSGERTDGSCSVVEKILANTKNPTIAALVDSFDRLIDGPTGSTSPLHLELDRPGKVRVILASARVGLTLKRGADRARCSFLDRHYRFLVEPTRLRKGRLHLAIARHQAGDALETIHRQTSIARAPIKRYLAAFAAGHGRNPADYRHKLTTTELCELLGALASRSSQDR